MAKVESYIVLAFLLCLGCNSSEPPMDICEDNPLDDLQSDYAVSLYRYSWNMGEGVRMDSTIEANIFFSDIGSEHLRVALENVDIIVYLNKITETGYNFSRSFLSPHSHAYLSFRCHSDTARLDFRFGALGFDDWYVADFRYR